MTPRVHRDRRRLIDWQRVPVLRRIVTLKLRNRASNDRTLTVPAPMRFAVTVREKGYFEA